MRGKSNWQRVDPISKKIKLFAKKGGLSPWYWIYRFKWNYYPKLFHVGKFPTELIIETSSLCNLKCIMCFRNYLSNDVKLSHMDFELFKKIIDECKKNNISAVKLSWRGEVLLNKDFLKMVKYAKEAGIKEVTTLTNATKLSTEVSKGLIENGLDQIVFSFDGSTKETYEKIRIGADFEQVITNINKFLELKGKSKKLFTRIQLTKIPENINEVDNFLKIWGDKIDEIAVSDYVDYSNLNEKEFRRQNELVKAKGRLPCSSLWQRLAIMADGTATMCCMDVQGEIALGNIKNQSIKSIWNSKRLRILRRTHRKRDLDSIPLCRKCNARVTYEF